LKLGFLDAVILVLRRPDEADGKGGPVLPAKSNRLWWETTAGRGDWADLKVSERPPMQLARCREI
ncbi:unnamed protein product, partial [Polarella glacialis]